MPGCCILETVMSNATTEPTPELEIRELLKIYPGARRTLFQLHHIGGCSSCGFSETETLSQICERNGALDPFLVLAEIVSGHLSDGELLLSPEDLHARIGHDSVKILDIRTREEFEAVSIPGSRIMTQERMQESMNWPKDTELVLVDHTGTRVLDAAAYFAGHGFTRVKGLQGGIDAYSETMDPNLPRYNTESL